MVGIVVDPDGDLSDLAAVRTAILGAGMLPLVIGPHGGTVDGTPVQRTFATVRSVELDAVLVAGSPPPAPDAMPSRAPDSAESDTAPVLDPRVRLLLEEAWRHSKAIGAWGAGTSALDTVGISADAGVVTGSSGPDVLEQLTELLALHRVWDRFPAA